MALFAIGSAPDGPWRLSVSGDPWTTLKNAQAGNHLHLVAGALVWFEADVWAKRSEARALVAIASVQRAQGLRPPWFVMPVAAVQAMLVTAAHGDPARCWSHADWVARLDARERV